MLNFDKTFRARTDLMLGNSAFKDCAILVVTDRRQELASVLGHSLMICIFLSDCPKFFSGRFYANIEAEKEIVDFYLDMSIILPKLKH